jgi:hypothetical protein
MTNDKEKQESYQAQLRARVEKWWDDEGEGANLDKLHAFIKEVALESFKNGVTVGQRRARPATPKARLAEQPKH